MRITLNGEPHELPGPCSVLQLLEGLKLPEAGVVVEHNQQVVRRAERASAQVKEGDQVEILRFMGGGTSPGPLNG
jgi:sulfur carrier protein